MLNNFRLIHGLAGDIYRIASPRKRNDVLDFRLCCHRQTGDVEAKTNCMIGHKNTNTARDRDKTNAVSGREQTAGAGITDVEKLIHRVGTVGVEFLEDGIDHAIRTGE